MKYNIGDMVVVYNIEDREYQYAIVLEVREFSIQLTNPDEYEHHITYKILNQKNPYRYYNYPQSAVYPIDSYAELIELQHVMHVPI